MVVVVVEVVVVAAVIVVGSRKYEFVTEIYIFLC